LIAFWMDGIGLGQAPCILPRPLQVEKLNCRLQGQLLDFTHNHGHDRRIWSAALGQRRDLYVYLPPGFDPRKKYPLSIFLHGAGQDEHFFLQTQVERFDKAIAAGLIPPVIVAAPDGSMTGRASVFKLATFWANSRAGNFEDYLMEDVWQFLMHNFPILPDRDAHALVGASMGGSAAFALAIKHRDRIKVALGFHPLLNLRYVDCHGHYRTKFDEECWDLRSQFHGCEALGRRRFFTLRFRDLFTPMFGHGDEALAGMSRINPLELMEQTNLRDGELDLYVAYGGKDEFNVAAQVESFLSRAKERGVTVTVDYHPDGKHDLATGRRMMPQAMKWIAQRVPESRLSQWRQQRSILVPALPTRLQKTPPEK
jgi:S-formylglutathione hydrolase FrmB